MFSLFKATISLVDGRSAGSTRVAPKILITTSWQMGLVMLSLKKTRRGTQVPLPSRACLFRALVKSGTSGGCESVKWVRTIGMTEKAYLRFIEIRSFIPPAREVKPTVGLMPAKLLLLAG